MKKGTATIVALIAALMTLSFCGCTVKSRETEAGRKKVADQHLVTYSPLRRLIYRDACASEGPITVCVDKIIVSDTSTLVETRMKNSSRYTYSYEAGAQASVLLANEKNEKLELVSEKSGHSIEPGEKAGILFRMDGHFRGEPSMLLVSNIGKAPAEGCSNQPEKEYSVSVNLGR